MSPHDPARPASRLEAAAAQLAGLSWPVFRVRPRDKRPIAAGWQAEATVEPAAARALWRRSPRANLGLICGAAFWVLDVDGAAGRATLAALLARHGPLPTTVTSITGSGGEHRLFAMPEARVIRNSAGKLGPGLDARGRGGFIVAPPSIHPNGRRYAWAPGLDPWSVGLATAPAWLIDLLDPPPARPLPPARWPVAAGSRYAEAVLRRAVERVATAAPGTRNCALNAEAWALGRLAASGLLDPAVAATALAGAGLAAGLDAREVERTLASGLRAWLGNRQGIRHA